MARVVLCLGTKKGMFLLQSDEHRSEWEQSGPFLAGVEVNHAMLDARSNTLYATDNNPWFGARIAVSNDLGASWSYAEGGPKFAEDSGKSVARGWRLTPGAESEPGVVYCGVDPASMFVTRDWGKSWVEDAALNNHATRERWTPGNGGLIIHSIVLDPKNPARRWVAISAAGVFRTEDGGASWQPANTNLTDILHKYDPKVERTPVVGQCVHHLVHAGGDNDRLYAQSHWGTWRSDNGGDSWTEITAGLPSDFGLTMAAHPRNPDVAYVLPLVGGEFRCPPEGKLRVWKTSDAGATWQPMSEGLPQEDAFMGNYREGMCTDTLDPAGVYFGTNTGQLYASIDEGSTWRRLTSDLPPVSSVSATVLG